MSDRGMCPICDAGNGRQFLVGHDCPGRFSMTKITDDSEQWIAEAVHYDGTVTRLGNADSKDVIVKALSARFEAEEEAGTPPLFSKVFDRNTLDYVRVYLFEDRYIPTKWWNE